MKQYSRVCERVDLDAIFYNFQMMKANIKDGVKMIAVIKTDGYGHGAVQIARLLEPVDYIWGYAVATLDEAVVLRKNDIKKPILVLGCIFPDQWEAMIENEVRMTTYTVEMAKGVSNLAVKMGKDAYIHIKLDTGMSRLGFQIHEDSVDAIEEISKMPGLKLEGMFTHFAKADETDKAYTDVIWYKPYVEKAKDLNISEGIELDATQFITREQAAKIIYKRGVSFPIYHCSNSAGIIDIKKANMDLVRAGISIYGLYPSEEVEKKNVPLRPAMELISHVSYVKTVPEGTPVSYGGTYVTEKETSLATIPVGYGDGYPRSLSNKGYVLIHGKKAPIRGRVCMDQFMVDVTDIPDVKFGDKVTLVGKDGDEFLPVETLSDLSGRFNYEFVCDLGKRIPREYIQNGQVIEQVDYFDV